MVAGADGLRCDARKRLPDAAGRAVQPPYSRLCQSARHSCDRLFGRAAQARPCGRISGQDNGHPGSVSGAGRPSPGAGVGCRGETPHRKKEADALCEPLFVSHPRPRLGPSDHQDQRASSLPAQVILNGHEYVACQARKAGIAFTKEGNCFTTISDAAGLAKIAETLSEHRAVGRLSQVCERWIYSCVCFALDFDEQKRSGFRYQYSNYQIEYSRNLVFEVGGHMDQVFQALIDRSRAPLDLKTIKTILGYRHRPKYRRRTKRSAEWEVAVERPTYDLTIFKLHCGKLTLKIYTKGERVLRIEAVAHNTQELNCGRSLEKFPELVSRLKAVLEKFADALSCIDQCFIADEMLEHLPLASQVGKTVVGGIDLNKARMCQVVEALIALSPSPNGFTASEVAAEVRASRKRTPLHYGPRHAAYDLKKLRGKQIIRRIGHPRRYEPLPTGLRAMTALIVLRNKAIKPLLAAAQPLHPTRGAHNPTPIDTHYQTIQVAMKGVFHELGLAA